MTAIDTRMRDAWNSGDPMALHHTAEQLATEGKTESAILDSLEKLLLDVRAAGADDDKEERIMGVMDRLTGWCHESGHIRTKPSDLPTEEEIALLPWWARVFLAVRCARRVLPLYTKNWPTASQHDVLTLLRVTEATERAVQAATKADDRIAEDAQFVATDATYSPAGLAMNPAAAVMHAAFAAVKDDPQNHSAYSARYAHHAGVPEHVVRMDYDKLLKLAADESWGHSTPIPTDVIGPLWPDGPPEGWPTFIEESRLSSDQINGMSSSVKSNSSVPI